MADLHLNCPHCHTTNRVPAERTRAAPICGRCKAPLFAGVPLELTAGNVQPTLERNDIPVLVDCWAPWCGPCQSFAPVFAQAARELEPHYRLAKLNTDAVPDIAGRWQIRSIPTLILFRGGRELARVSGAMSLPQLRQWLEQATAA
jgi:thioredoxin 2